MFLFLQKQLELLITALLNVALNQCSNVSVLATGARGGGGEAKGDSECDRAIGGIMSLLRRHCCYSWLLGGFCQRVYCVSLLIVGSEWSADVKSAGHGILYCDILKWCVHKFDHEIMSGEVIHLQWLNEAPDCFYPLFYHRILVEFSFNFKVCWL